MRLLLLFPLMLVTGPQLVMHDTVSKISLMIKTGETFVCRHLTEYTVRQRWIRYACWWC
jgi:hypothetical protein